MTSRRVDIGHFKTYATVPILFPEKKIIAKKEISFEILTLLTLILESIYHGKSACHNFCWACSYQRKNGCITEHKTILDYRKTSCISRTKFQNLIVSSILMQLFSLNLLKPGIKLRMKMLLEQRRQAMLQLHLSYQQF